ncbi:MAG TPA: SRPBCC family protein [Flavitalea sp.]|nr:SRPBCC family protein [Flavitalea sp.]
MTDKLRVQTSIIIQAPVNKVWQALTDPSLIKEYLFGTNTVTDWKKGSEITWSGMYEGKSYQDKGTVIEVVPEKKLHTTHYSPLSGKEDKPENYHNVIYELVPKNEHTLITLTQDNVTSEKELEHLQKNWNMVLEGMKKSVEGDK